MNDSEVDKIDLEFERQEQQALAMVSSLDEKLTQYSFLANSGGAIAVLGFIGTNQANSMALWPLSLFVLGVICSGIEYRSLLIFFSALHTDALNRRKKYNAGVTNINELVPPKNVGGIHTKINHWAGIAAQVCFALGSLIGVLGLACNT